jgi:hypothetical protein
MTFFGGVCVALTRRRVPEQPNIFLWFFKFKKNIKKKSKLRGMLFHVAQSILSSSGVAVLFFGGAGRRSRGKP